MNRLGCLKRGLLLTVAVLVTGCAGYAPTDAMIGQNRDEIVAVLGQPSSEAPIEGGTRLNFPRGPFGKHTYFVYLDESGKMARWKQVLDEKNFDKIRPGMMREEVIGLVGESKVRDGLARGRGYIWSYRYVNQHCFWFRVEFTPEDIVRSTMYTKPPECRARGAR